MAITWPNPKDPNERLPYTLDWIPRLGTASLASSEWLVVQDDQDDGQLTIFNSNFTPQNTTVWLEGGTVGRKYTLLNRVETANGWTMDQSVRLKIKSK